MAGLGRGLNALLSDTKKAREQVEKKQVQAIDPIPEAQIEISKNSIVEIAIEKLTPSIYQPRKSFDEESLQELAQSINDHGLLEPLLVKKRENDYEIICGERRFRACKIAGITKVPCLLRDDLGQDAYAVALIENIQREDLNPLEMAQAFALMLDECKLTQEELAKSLGKSRSSIANILRLNSFSEEMKELILSKQIDLGHAKVLLAIDDAQSQYKAALYVIKHALTVRQTEDFVKKLKDNKIDESEPQKTIYSNEKFANWEKNLGTQLSGVKVKFKATSENNGRVTLAYSSKEQLDKLLALLALD